MRKEYDFSRAKRARDVPHLAKLQAELRGKTRITIYLDDDIIEAFRARAEAHGSGYQTLINAALRAAISPDSAPLTEATLRKTLRKILREEMKAV